MDTFKSYTERVITIPPVIGGYRLKPFSLGHTMLLKSVNSKFLSDDYAGLCNINTVFEFLVCDLTLIGEFALAILICSTTFEDFMEEVNNGEFGNALEQIRTEILGNPAVVDAKGAIIEKAVEPMSDLPYQIHRFAHYLKQGTVTPKYNIRKSDSITTSPIEPEVIIQSKLMSEFGWTMEQTYNRPFTQAISSYFLYLHENSEDFKLESKEVFELKQKLKMEHNE